MKFRAVEPIALEPEIERVEVWQTKVQELKLELIGLVGQFTRTGSRGDLARAKEVVWELEHLLKKEPKIEG